MPAHIILSPIESTTTTTITRKLSRICPKCATIKKSGKRSCCAPGGAWFKNCGSAVSASVDYTWAEGVRACTGFWGSFSGKERSQVMLHHEKPQPQPNTTLERNGRQQYIVHYLNDDMSDADITDCEGCHSLAKTIVFGSILFTVLRTSWFGNHYSLTE